jgi:hypothetical protein
MVTYADWFGQFDSSVFLSASDVDDRLSLSTVATMDWLFWNNLASMLRHISEIMEDAFRPEGSGVLEAFEASLDRAATTLSWGSVAKVHPRISVLLIFIRVARQSRTVDALMHWRRMWGMDSQSKSSPSYALQP